MSRKVNPPQGKIGPGAPLDNDKQTGRNNHRLFANWISLTGAAVMLIAFVMSAFLLSIELVSGESASYMGIVYMLLLGCLVMGMVLVPLGMLRHRRKIARGDPHHARASLIIDLGKPAHRNAALALLGSSVLVALIMAAGSYKVYQLTESNDFCGQVCHSVMEPEAVAYQYSSHARVKCVECHIGSGAGWYMRSKLSGLSQIVAVAANTFPRPIPTPIHNLRPARETCEQCHWPSKFIGYREFVRTYHLADEANSPYKIRMLMKIGGERSALAAGSGIHYHMLIAAKVEYIARDSKRQEIPWVRIRRSDGSVTEFSSTSEPLTEEEKSTLPVREMDCMDCHNRPSHKFPSPTDAVNASLEQGLISPKLPFIKLEATRALSVAYESSEQATAGLANHLRNYYREHQPEIMEKRLQEVMDTVAEVQRIYSRSNFPAMNAKWSAYPDNIGHRDWPGCFRCHRDDMRSKDDQAIFTSCNKCHLILAQGKTVDQAKVNFEEGQPFFHPGDREDVNEFTECTDCHTGGAEIYN